MVVQGREWKWWKKDIECKGYSESYSQTKKKIGENLTLNYWDLIRWMLSIL